MRLSHDPAKTHASFDDPNLVSRAGLVPVMALAQRCGLADLAGEHVTITSPAGVNPHLKIPGLVAGMAAGADSIDDMDVLRHGAMTEVFGGIRAPSTLGSFLRSFTWGNVRQLDAVGRELLTRLASAAPLLPGAGVLAFIDMDSMQKRVYGHAKDGAGFGHTKIQGKSLTGPRPERAGSGRLHAAGRAGDRSRPAARRHRELPPAAPRRWPPRRSARPARPGAPARSCSGSIRRTTPPRCSARSARAGARFSVTVRMDPKIRAAIAAIGEDAWTADHLPAGGLG